MDEIVGALKDFGVSCELFKSIQKPDPVVIFRLVVARIVDALKPHGMFACIHSARG